MENCQYQGLRRNSSSSTSSSSTSSTSSCHPHNQQQDTDTHTRTFPTEFHTSNSVIAFSSLSPTLDPLESRIYLGQEYTSLEERRSQAVATRRSLKYISNRSLHVWILRFIWFFGLFIGEYGSFWAFVTRCSWPENSSWDTSHEAKTERYRVIIIADPQLTDWFSYGQSGFLLTLVEIYTDLFMRRAFSRLHASLKPDAVLFLGDLNDGGRESSDAVFEKNGKRFFERVFQTRRTAWNQQPLVVDPVFPMEGQHDAMPSSPSHYRQVENVPLAADVRAKIRTAGQSVRFYVAGNHDVGFGDTLIRPSMTRYKKMFGAVNYEIEVGNHSFVVLDTLSLSSGIQDIRQESVDFLNKISQEPPKLPRILFTHVPLFRLDTTKCGPERETTQLIVNGNGTQYQNMVNLTLSQQILAGVQPDMIFSGDDHDWCEVAHPVVNNSSNDTISSFSPEVTLPTFSFAQGIMQPGFVVMSLYNPSPQKVRNVYPAVPAASGLPTTLNETMSRSIARPSTDATFAYAECLLPVQLFIYLGYGIFFVCTVMTIVGLRFWWMEHKERQYREDALQQLGQEQEQEQPSQHADLMVLVESTTSTSSPMANEPLSPLPSYTANIRYDGHEIIADLSSYGYAAAHKRYWWPIQSPIFWKMCGWDVWNVAKYAIPFYFFLFIMSII